MSEQIPGKPTETSQHSEIINGLEIPVDHGYGLVPEKTYPSLPDIKGTPKDHGGYATPGSHMANRIEERRKLDESIGKVQSAVAGIRAGADNRELGRAMWKAHEGLNSDRTAELARYVAPIELSGVTLPEEQIPNIENQPMVIPELELDNGPGYDPKSGLTRFQQKFLE